MHLESMVLFETFNHGNIDIFLDAPKIASDILAGCGAVSFNLTLLFIIRPLP